MRLKPSLLISISLFSFMSFSSCGMMDKGDKKDSAGMKENIPVSNLQDVVIDSDYVLSLPKHMYISHELNPHASLQYNDTAIEEYIIVIDESKDDFVKDFTDSGAYNPKMSVVQNYRSVQMNFMQSGMKMIEGPTIKPLKINGLNSEIIDLIGNVPEIGSDIYYKIAFVEGPKNLYMIMTWTLSSYKDKNNAEMDAMLNSFKLAK